MGATKRQTRTLRDLIIEVWKSLDCEAVGAPELHEIQRVIRERLGEGAVESPATIARTLCDEGAVLRLPEVLECDAKWREQNSREAIFKDVLNFGDLAESLESIKELERLRSKLAFESDQAGLRRLHEAMRQTREDCLLVARSEVVDEGKRGQAGEVAEWLSVWLKQPEIFVDWLELRRRSPEFRQRFGEPVD